MPTPTRNRRQTQQAETREACAEDLAFLLTHGEHPERAARRVGLTDARHARDFARRHGYTHITELLRTRPENKPAHQTNKTNQESTAIR